jgi:predicted RNA-binding protein
MCQATVYWGEEKVAQEVIRLQPVGKGVRLETFFEKPWVVQGTIKEIDFLKHRVLLEPVEGHEDERT